MAKDHGSSVKDDKQYEGWRKKGMSQSRAAAIPTRKVSSRGGKEAAAAEAAGSGGGSGGNRAQKAAAGRKGKESGKLATGRTSPSCYRYRGLRLTTA